MAEFPPKGKVIVSDFGPGAVENPSADAERYERYAFRQAESQNILWQKPSRRKGGKHYQAGSAFIATGNEKIIEAPRPNTLGNLYIWMHEVYHHFLGHLHGNKPYHLEEYEATKGAIDTMSRDGFPINSRISKEAAWNIAHAIRSDKRKSIRIRPEAEAYVTSLKSGKTNPTPIIKPITKAIFAREVKPLLRAPYSLMPFAVWKRTTGKGMMALYQGGRIIKFDTKQGLLKFARSNPGLWDQLKGLGSRMIGKNPAKLERCVRAVKKKGGAVSPYAVCKAKLEKNPHLSQIVYLDSGGKYQREGPVFQKKSEAMAEAKSMAASGQSAEVVWRDSRTGKYHDRKFIARKPNGDRQKEAKKRFLAGYRKNAGGFSVVQGKASADVAPSGSAWVVRIKGDKPKEFKSVEAAAKYARLRVHETAPAQNAKRGNGKRSLISKLVHSRKLSSNPRGNPEESAVQMYHVFHGKPATQVLEFVQREHVHEWLWAAGTLVSITVANGNQQMTLMSADPDEDEPEDVVMVGFSEDGRQAYFVGGDQDIDLDRLMEEFSMTEDDIRDHMKIGQVQKLTYRTSKNFEEGGKVDIDFYHKLGGEHSKGVMPDLIFKPLNPSMELVGGRYFVAPKDGQLGASPGVVG